MPRTSAMQFGKHSTAIASGDKAGTIHLVDGKPCGGRVEKLDFSVTPARMHCSACGLVELTQEPVQ